MASATGADILTMYNQRLRSLGNADTRDSIGPAQPGNTNTRPEPEDRLWESFLSAWGEQPGAVLYGQPGLDGSPIEKPPWDFGQQEFKPANEREQFAQDIGHGSKVVIPMALTGGAAAGPALAAETLLGGMMGTEVGALAKQEGAGGLAQVLGDAGADIAMSTLVGGPLAGGAAALKQTAKKSARFVDLVPDLRQLPDQASAYAIAKTNPHLRKVGKAGYTGAPPGVKGPKTLQKMQDKFSD